MSRVNESRDAQRLLDQRRLEQQQKDKAKGDGAQFSRVMTERQENTARANQKAQAESGQQAGQQSQAGNALLARQGIQANRFATTLQQQGKQSLGQGEAHTKSRDSEALESRRSVGQKDAEADGKRISQQGDKLAAISRDDRQQGGGGERGGERGGKEGQLPTTQIGGPAQVESAQQAAPTQQAQAAAAPKLSPEVINQIVERVLVGVNKEGLSEFHIELKGNILAGSSVHVTAKDGKISARFDTPDANVRRLIKASEGALARAFERKGLRLERLDVGGP